MRPIFRIALVAMSVALIHGCSSKPTAEDKAGVEERTPGGPIAPPPPPTTGTQNPGGVTGVVIQPAKPVGPNALRDPNNILSKRSIFFDYDSDLIKEEYQAILRAHARYLADNRAAKVLVQGNTDERGSREYNLSLGQRRAEAVKRAMILMGVQEAQIEAVSLGEEKPRCEEKTDACYAQNRRGDLLHSGEF
jgi:peptidoglycan-associated lipoprotein